MTRLAIATGDPAGIGPEVSVRALAALGDGVSATLFGDGRDLLARLARAGLGGRVEVHDAGPCDPAVVRAHADHAASGRLALAALDAAIDAVLEGRASAVVTAPVTGSKA